MVAACHNNIMLSIGIFSIDPTSGGLSLMSTLDRERDDNYVLSVVARDGGAEPRSSNATVSVTVLDENDNDPEILNIESLITSVEVPEVRHSDS